MIRIITAENVNILSVTSVTEQPLSQFESNYYREQRMEIVEHENERFALISMPIIWLDGSVVNLQVLESLRATYNNLKVLQLVLFVSTGIATIAITLSSRLLSKLITKPITSMIKTMKDIQKSGKFKRLKLERHSRDELVEMGEAFNRMINLLEANYKKQEQFVSSASHELRTPLTIIESYAHLLKRRGLEQPDIFEESIEAIYSEAVRMNEMTQQLLLLAKNQEQWRIQLEIVQLNKLMKEIVNSFRNAYQREVQLEMEENITIYTDLSKLKQLLFIFLDNARKYSDELISVSVGANGKEGLFIRILDRGIGIPKAEQEKVFDLFYRVDKARSRKISGTGLGLTLAKEIADAIGARIELESMEGLGTTVTLLLQRNKSDVKSSDSH